MKSVLEKIDLLKEQSGAGTGSMLKCGGEKDTGGGRESGSGATRSYTDMGGVRLKP